MFICLLCGGIFCACSEGEHEHVFVDGEIFRAPTCTAGGTRIIECECGTKRLREVPAFGHDWVEGVVKTPVTCTKNGKAIMECSRCSFRDDTVLVEVPALGHDFSEWETLCEADCLHTGLQTRACQNKNCELHEERISTSMLSHEYVNGKCVTCGRRDWTNAEIDNPDLYNSEYAFLGLAQFTNGAQMQTLYREIEADARSFHTSGETPATLELGEYDYEILGLEFDDVVTVWKAFLDDHPLYYWLSRTLAYDRAVVLIDEDYKDGYYRSELNALIYETAKQWREEASEGAYAAALCYHDKILDAVDYAYDEHRVPQEASWAHNIVGVFEGKGAVCEGYARTFQLLLNASGVENYFVSGTSNGAPHAWNLVKLDDGKWYWADLTFDDGASVDFGLLAMRMEDRSYNYFLVDEVTNVNWSDSDLVLGDAFSFLEKHTVDSGTGVTYMPPLPARAIVPYSVSGELTLRDTFNIGEFKYALEGHGCVRLVSCPDKDDIDVIIPETVKYNGREYTVTSIGGMDDKAFVDGQVFKYDTRYGTVTIPK
ncbi:MAG: hypothetical protein K2N74_02685, partial [Clostridiales bacterium]|nr:hypothetical protein [Clostridiales bacterium]